MQNNLYVNSILELWPEFGENEEEISSILLRVLWLDANYVVTINLEEKVAQPVIHDRKEIEDSITVGEIKITSFVMQRLSIPDSKLKDKHKEMRDYIWTAYMKDLASERNIPDIFSRRYRGIIIEQIHDKTGISKTLLRRDLRRYWQRGMVINALLPDYHNVGNAGMPRKRLGKKLGRPTVAGKEDPDLVGINITEEIKKDFRKSISMWFNKREKRTLYEVYELMLKKFFNAGYDDIEGVILKLAHEMPTYRQFSYWYKEERDIKDEYATRVGSRRVKLKHREIEGRYDKKSFGPGSIYQIDATIGNVYLVNRYNRNWVIGRPVIYFVIDIFSRLIAGVYIGLEGPSWIGAALALENAASDKVEYCKKFDIGITPDQWPAFGLPDHLTTDRGEYVGTKPAHLTKTLNVKLEHLPPYRPDWKPYVEKTIDLSNSLYVKWIPGGILERIRERGEADIRSDATLDLHEFETIVIQTVLYHNQHYLANYRRNDAMIEDDVTPKPNSLWQWGRKKGLGSLRYVSKDELRMNLLPSRTGAFTASGIKFNNHLFTSVTAEEENWRFLARNGTRIRVEYSFDPRDTSRIFLRHDNGGFEECFQLEQQNPKYTYVQKEYRWEEEVDLLAFEARMHKKGKHHNTESKMNTVEKVQTVIKNRAKENENSGMSSKNKIKPQEIRINKSITKQEEREKNAWRIENTQEGTVEPGKVLSFPKRSQEEKIHIEHVEYSEALRRGMEDDE